jgi:monofunctional biosynthetic peptidoglycan transglycosylase
MGRILFKIAMVPVKALAWTLFTVTFCLGAFATYVFWKVPSDKTIKGCFTTSMYQVYLCPGSKNYVPLKQISPYVIKAILSTEDSAFFSHDGFDWEQMENSFKKNIEKKGFYRGGSTITQQLAKNLFLSKEKSISRKVIEAAITYKLETVLSKPQILERYMNVVQFDKNVFGVKAAAEHYFRKAPSQLNLMESAFLAFLLPNPEKYSRSFHRKQLTPYAHKRLKQIVLNLYSAHRVSEEEYQGALAALPIFLGSRPGLGTGASSKDDQEQDQDQDDDSSFNPLNWLRSDDDSSTEDQ